MANKHSERTIQSFRSKLIGGGARSNLFEVDIEYPTDIGLIADADFEGLSLSARGDKRPR